LRIKEGKMSWIDDIIKNSVMKAFDDPQIQAKVKAAILNALLDKDVITKLNGIIDLRIASTSVIPTPTPVPQPTPQPGPVTGLIVVADLDTIPGRMRSAGFQGRDGVLYYALAQIYSGRPNSAPDTDTETKVLFERQDEIIKWWNGEVDKVSDQLKAHPGLQAKVIEHDGRINGVERLGCRLVGPTMERLAEFGDRVQPGDVFPESGY
jgi:hypothetical protein